MFEKMLGPHYVLHIVLRNKHIYLIFSVKQLGFLTAFLASCFQLLGILLLVYVEFEPLWPRSLCCRIALDYDAHKLPYSPYIQSIEVLAIVVFLVFSLTASEHFSCDAKVFHTIKFF